MGLPYGAHGVALSYSIVMTLWVIPHIAWCVHGTKISLKDIMLAIARPLASAIVAAALSGGVVFLCSDSMSPFLRLCIGLCVLLGAYVGMLFYVMRQKDFYPDIVSGLKGRPPGPKRTPVGLT